jgi:hypothetical protein
VTLRFGSTEQRDAFEGKVSESTFTPRAWWFAPRSDDSLQVTGFEVLVEPVDTEVPENVALFSTRGAVRLGSRLLLEAESARHFQTTTWSDVRWLLRRLGRLQRAEWVQVVREAGYPGEVAEVVLEKLLARRNELVRAFGLERDSGTLEARPPKTLSRARLEGYLQKFSYGQAESPLSSRELGGLFRIQALGSALDYVVAALNSQISSVDASMLQRQRMDFRMQRTFEYLITHPGSVYVEPVESWSGVVGDLGLTASRSIGFTGGIPGQSAAQLVDRFGVGASIGLHGGIDGLPPGILPSGTLQAALGRESIHSRNIGRISQAASVNWREVLMPGHPFRLCP